MDKKSWEEIIIRHTEANFLHSWSWGEFHKSLGKKVFRKILNTGLSQGVMLSIVEKAKRATYLTVPGGPIIDWNNKKTVKAFKEEIIKTAKENDCSFVRVRPQILDTSQNRRKFKNLGFRPSPMHLHAELTHQLDLTQSEEKLLSAMRKNTRYEIKKAEKIGIKTSTSTDTKLIKTFYKHQISTADRQHFIPFSYKYLFNQFQIFAKENQVVLYSATLNSKLLTQAFIIFYGQEADYHYSVSTDLNRRHPGSYALLWQAIRDAKKKGFKRFNFWGVAPENSTKHRFYGVSVFKRGFRGRDVAYLPAHDFVLNPLKYSLNWIVEQFRKYSRSL